MRKATSEDFKALLSLVYDGQLDQIKELIRCTNFSLDVGDVLPEDLNSPLNIYTVPLYEAAQRGQVNIVECLIDNGFDSSFLSSKSLPLFAASRRGRLEVVRVLIEEYGYDVNTTSLSNRTALFAAVESDNLELVKYLVGAGADVNHVSDVGTILHECIPLKNRKLIDYILSQGFTRINTRDSEGCTVLYKAVYLRFESILDVLVEHGSDVNLAKGELYPLYSAISQGCSLNTIKRLRSFGADPDVEGPRGLRPVHEAIKQGRFDVVHYLLVTLNVSVTWCGDQGTGLSPLRLASRYKRLSSLILLIEAGFTLLKEDFDSLSDLVETLPTGFTSSYISRVLSTPRSLADTCCFSIRRVIGINLPQSVDDLPLPRKLIDFVKLTHLDLTQIKSTDGEISVW